VLGKRSSVAVAAMAFDDDRAFLLLHGMVGREREAEARVAIYFVNCCPVRTKDLFPPCGPFLKIRQNTTCIPTGTPKAQTIFH
jgi:hypothetical protein